MSTNAERYVKLESLMVALDELAPEAADVVRDTLDVVWEQMNERERAWARSRSPFNPLTRAETLISQVRATAQVSEIAPVKIVSGWRVEHPRAAE